MNRIALYRKTRRIHLVMSLKLCQQKQKAGLEDCGGGIEWGDEGELTFQTVVDKRDWHSKQQHQDSSSSDEDDEDPRDMHMEVDTTDRTFFYLSKIRFYMKNSHHVRHYLIYFIDFITSFQIYSLGQYRAANFWYCTASSQSVGCGAIRTRRIHWLGKFRKFREYFEYREHCK